MLAAIFSLPEAWVLLSELEQVGYVTGRNGAMLSDDFFAHHPVERGVVVGGVGEEAVVGAVAADDAAEAFAAAVEDARVGFDSGGSRWLFDLGGVRFGVDVFLVGLRVLAVPGARRRRGRGGAGGGRGRV